MGSADAGRVPQCINKPFFIPSHTQSASSCPHPFSQYNTYLPKQHFSKLVSPELTHLLIYPQFSAERNAVSLGLRCRWGMRNGIFQVAKEEGSDEVLGVAMWLRPRPAGQAETWTEWLDGWRLWFGQVRMNLWYGRGGLIVKVSARVLDRA